MHELAHKNALFLSPKYRHTWTSPAAAQGARHENSFNWLEGSFDSGGLREKTKEKARERERPWKRHFTWTHMRTQPGMPKHLTPRHKHQCCTLNVVPITDSCWDNKGWVCYDETTKETARDRLKEVTVRDKDSTSTSILKVNMYSKGKIKIAAVNFSLHPGITLFSDLNFTVSFKVKLIRLNTRALTQQIPASF